MSFRVFRGSQLRLDFQHDELITTDSHSSMVNPQKSVGEITCNRRKEDEPRNTQKTRKENIDGHQDLSVSFRVFRGSKLRLKWQ